MTHAITITAIKAFNDNYIWCLHDDEFAVVVDPGDAEPVLAFLSSQKLILSDVLITHHHYDHTGGVLALLEQFPNVPVTGPANKTIKGLTKFICEDDTVAVLKDKITFSVLETPGHTLDHIAFYNAQWVFCGDTLFSAGCGRMFEGTAEVFLNSLDKLSALPGITKVYCAHEYTLANVTFARHLTPKHQALCDYEQWAEQQRNNDQITLPSSIEEQRTINPFLRCHESAFQKDMADKLQRNLNNAVDTFAAVRAAKDNF